MTTAAHKILEWTERGLVPDSVIRAGIRRLCRQRLKDASAHDPESASTALERFVDTMRSAPVALVPDLANEQHYEVPSSFFDLVLGQHRKYSCCHWDTGARTLDQAESEALNITCQRAGIGDGMEVLDLGCGWGSLSLWIADQYPSCRVTSVSNSAAQRQHIQRIATERGLTNLQVLTRDMNDFDTDARFDRVVSVEMFEHMRNWGELFRRIRGWLRPRGRFFMHVFCHRSCAYAFVDDGPGDWMSRHFFSGGMMPSDDLALRFQDELRLVRRFRWSGRHYEQTANAWLQNMDSRREAIMPIMAATYGKAEAEHWFQRWRIFFMACAELFGLNEGREWYVAHYLFERREREAPRHD